MAVGGLVEGLFAEEVPLLDHLRGPFRRRTGRAARTRPGGHIAGPFRLSRGPKLRLLVSHVISEAPYARPHPAVRNGFGAAVGRLFQKSPRPFLARSLSRSLSSFSLSFLSLSLSLARSLATRTHARRRCGSERGKEIRAQWTSAPRPWRETHTQAQAPSLSLHRWKTHTRRELSLSLSTARAIDSEASAPPAPQQNEGCPEQAHPQECRRSTRSSGLQVKIRQTTIHTHFR